jgi:hypothetical protein
VIEILDIDAWAAEVAESEAQALRLAVRDVVLAGGGITGALDEVRRRLARLTPEQRETVVGAIGVTPGSLRP